MNPGSARSTYVPSTQRYEEVAHHRSELEIVKRENEALRRRIRDLERALSSRRQSESSTRPNELASSHLGIRQAAAGTAVDEEDDSVNVGESAASAGVGGGH